MKFDPLTPEVIAAAAVKSIDGEFIELEMEQKATYVYNLRKMYITRNRLQAQLDQLNLLIARIEQVQRG